MVPSSSLPASPRLAAAHVRAEEALGGATAPEAAPRRCFVVGDPQVSLARFLGVLDRHGLLGDDGWLARDVGLLSIGDHFDFDNPHPETGEQDFEPPRRDGLRLLAWLAAHAPSQVALLVGNHDLARVQEFAPFDDAHFQEAQALALAIAGGRDAARPEAAARLAALARGLPPGLFARDYAAYTEAQRALVVRLLLDGRCSLGCTVELPDGTTALATHAGVTSRELALLGIPAERDPAVLARALESTLRRAVARVADDWRAGGRTPLDLTPLHVAGGGGVEGGGLLYHRPANPDPQARAGSEPRLSAAALAEKLAWEFAADRPRRFDPRRLPRGLRQIVGHTGHARCLRELSGWHGPGAADRRAGGIRTLRVRGDEVRYDAGFRSLEAFEASLVLVDTELNRRDAEPHELLALGPGGFRPCST